MYKYCIQLFPLNYGAFDMRTADGRVTAVAKRETKIDAHIEMIQRGDESRIETWYCTEESEAKSIAKHLAAQKPSQAVHIFALKHVATSGVPKITISEYSDRGLVPI